MRILLIEDDDEKAEQIESTFNSLLDVGLKIERVEALDCARRKILSEVYDLIVFDIYLPVSKALGDNSEIDVSEEIIDDFRHSKNYRTEAIVITKYDISEIENLSSFNEAGVTVVGYSDSSSGWRESLKHKVDKVRAKLRYDFLIFCALPKERSGYLKSSARMGALRIFNGMDCQEIFIGDRKGLCLVPSSPGLVNMAILSAKAIEEFQPEIVAMSGICAGVSGESKPLDLVVAKQCWEYQTGKYKNGMFQQEPYQTRIPRSLEADISQFVLREDLCDLISDGVHLLEGVEVRIIHAPMSSGSAVVADKSKMEKICGQHRKMAALEMEMYSMYEAAFQSLSTPLYFGVKCVVDMADDRKDDCFHVPACIFSARFVVEFLSHRFSSRPL